MEEGFSNLRGDSSGRSEQMPDGETVMCNVVLRSVCVRVVLMLR